ncbi:MAG: DNA gyrase inhibitor YacG [Pseudomonadota bacterium]
MACPICSKPAFKAYRPFCSKRCADVDLGRWLNGNYAIPSEEGPDTVSNAVDQADEGSRNH